MDRRDKASFWVLTGRQGRSSSLAVLLRKRLDTVVGGGGQGNDSAGVASGA